MRRAVYSHQPYSPVCYKQKLNARLILVLSLDMVTEDYQSPLQLNNQIYSRLAKNLQPFTAQILKGENALERGKQMTHLKEN